jgi:adenosylcobyric acid synthase
MLEHATGRRTYGVVPWVPGLHLDLEDSLGMDAPRTPSAPPLGRDPLRVAVVRLPRTSNATDVDALAAEPGVTVRMVDQPDAVAEADLVVVPGSRSTVNDLRWLRERGIDVALAARAEKGLPILGICGGYQMLGTLIDDPVESGAGLVSGLGLLPVRTRFGPDKVLGRPRGLGVRGEEVAAYEIHHGVVTADGGEALFTRSDGAPEGCRVGGVWGTVWHGALENDLWRRHFLAEVAEAAGRDFAVSDRTSFARIREARLDLLGDLVEQHLDTAALRSLIRGGAPAGLPFVPPGAPEPADPSDPADPPASTVMKDAL